MCFYDDNDCDWYADYIEKRASEFGGKTQCDECATVIEKHHWRSHVLMRESDDQCVDCDGDCDGEGDFACVCETGPNLGREYDADMCRGCCALLAAIRRQERDEGCPQHAQQPEFGGLGLVFSGHQAAAVYAQRAVRLFPSLADHKFVRAALK